MRRFLILPLLALALGACGGDDEPQQPAESDRACPEGTPSLTARDVIGTTPEGYKVVKGDPVALGRVADNVERTMGPAYRDHDARVLARRRALNGTAVMVFNATERIPGPDELLQQQEAAEERAGVPADTMSIGGQDGRLYQAPDGGWVAVAQAGTCAMVLLVSDREDLIRDAATQVLNDG
jgi:hypothetical protein